MNHPSRWMLLCVCGMAIGFNSTRLSAQPQEQPPPPPADAAKAPEGEEPSERDFARRFISERLKRIEEQERALRESLEMLDRGEPLEKVRAHARGPVGERVDRFREGGPGMGPPGRGPDERRGERGRMDGPRRGGPDGDRGPDNRPPGSHAGPPDGPRGDDRGTPEPISLSSEERKMIIEMLMAHRPGLGERLERLRETKPEEFDAMIRRNTPHFLRMVEEKRRDPEMFTRRRELVEREFEVRRLARQIRESGQPATPEQTQQIKAAVERQFEARLQVEQQAVAHLRAEIEKAEHRRQKLEQDRGQLIEKGVKDALEGRDSARQAPREDAPPPPPVDRP